MAIFFFRFMRYINMSNSLQSSSLKIMMSCNDLNSESSDL